MRLRFTRAGEDELWASNEPPPTSAGRLLSLRVVGIVAPSGSFPPRPQAAGAGFAVLTPAFEAQQGSSLGGRVILAVWLRGGPAAVVGFARRAARAWRVR